jgi:hypothetical protein
VTIYWSARSIPELADLQRQAQRSLWRRVYPVASKERRVRLALLAVALFAGLGAFLGEQFGARVIGVVVAGALGGFVYGQVLVAAARPYFRTERSREPDEPAGGAV